MILSLMLRKRKISSSERHKSETIGEIRDVLRRWRSNRFEVEERDLTMKYRLLRGVGEGENLTAENRAPVSRMYIAADIYGGR